MDKQQKNFLHKLYGIKESKKKQDNVYEQIMKVSISLDDIETEAKVTNLLTDIRSITRVTVVSSVKSKTVLNRKVITIKIKFNVKNLEQEGYSSPYDFVEKLLVPAIQRLDTNPKVVYVGNPVDDLKKSLR